MNNDFGRQNDYARKDSRSTREGASSASAPQAAWAKGPDGARQPQEGETLNGLLTNKLLSALPAEDFSRLFPHLEPVSLGAGDVLYKLDEQMRYAYFPETAVISHLYILNEGA